MKVISRNSAYREPAPRKISVRTIPGSVRTVAEDDAPCSGAICENLPSIPLIFAFHGTGSLLQNTAIFRPVLGEIRGPRP